MATVQVLMSTYNGELYLREQIESLINQKEVEINILVRDDGSADGTIDILEEYKKKGVLNYYVGTNIKPANSFMDLIFNSKDAEYYAFCDQDDYWLPEKLIKAVEKIHMGKPSLYFSKAQLVDKELKPIKHKGYPVRAYTFGEALIKNNATGCTMVFNNQLLQVIKSYNPKFISMHDYWVYLVCLAVDGHVYFDSNSYIMYRQHGNNVVGGQKSIINEYRNKLKMLLYKDRTRYKIANEIKNGYYELMPEKNKKIIDLIIGYPYSLQKKFNLIRSNEVRTNSLKNNFMFHIAVIFNCF